MRIAGLLPSNGIQCLKRGEIRTVHAVCIACSSSKLVMPYVRCSRSGCNPWLGRAGSPTKNSTREDHTPEQDRQSSD